MSGEIKSCLECGHQFKQAAAPKATQVYCSDACHLAAKHGDIT